MARRGGRIRLRVSINDVILFLAIGYSVLVIVIKWSKYERCSQPLHWFLLADYFLLLLARSTMYTKYLLAEGSPWHRLVYLLKFAVLFPCFVAWTIVGTVWFSQSGRCLPDNNQYWAFVVWLALCYLAISVLVCYVSFRLAMGLDPGLDQMATNQDFSLGIMRYMDSRRGLPREEIFRIRPFAYAGSADVDVPDPLARFAPPPNEDVCSICIEPFKKNQLCKRIPACVHMFHAPCLNKWLTTQGFCPVCRATVIAPAAHAEQVPGAELEAATAAHPHDDYAITVSRPEVDVPSTPELLSILESVSTPEVSVSHIDPSDPALDEPQLETESKGADDCIVNDDEQSQRTGEPMV